MSVSNFPKITVVAEDWGGRGEVNAHHIDRDSGIDAGTESGGGGAGATAASPPPPPPPQELERVTVRAPQQLQIIERSKHVIRDGRVQYISDWPED